MDLEDVEGLRSKLRCFLSVGSAPGPPMVDVLSSTEEDGYVRHHVYLAAEDAIPAYLAVPAGQGPFPAVVIFHQHAGQHHLLGKSEVFGLVGDAFQAFGPALARAGLVVLAPDSIAFEGRRPGGEGTDPRSDDFDQHYNELVYRLVVGETLMHKVLEDAMVAVSVLAARDDVDSGRVGALGHSYGGHTTLFLMAVDERVRFGCASGALGSYRQRMADRTGIELAQVIPGFAARYDLDHLLAAIAPRPFLAVSGTDDRYAADADELVARASSAFSAHGATSALAHLRVRGGHALEAERFDAIITWMTKAASAPA